MLRYVLFRAGIAQYNDGLWVRFPTGREIVLHATRSRSAVGPTQPPTRCVSEAVSPGIERTLSSAEIKNEGAIPLLPHVS